MQKIRSHGVRGMALLEQGSVAVGTITSVNTQAEYSEGQVEVYGQEDSNLELTRTGSTWCGAGCDFDSGGDGLTLGANFLFLVDGSMDECRKSSQKQVTIDTECVNRKVPATIYTLKE